MQLHHLFARKSHDVVRFDADRVVLRRAREDDLEAIARLELLDSRRLPGRDLVVAEADGEIVAAADRRSGAAIADPFRPSAGIVGLLRSWTPAS